MILDRIEHLHEYEGMHPLFAEGVAFAQSLREAPVGRYELHSGVFAMVQEGETRPSGLLEAHRSFWDVQFVLQGEEAVVWQHLSQLKEAQAYDSEKDFALYEGEGVTLTVTPDMFYVMLPQDGHAPCLHGSAPSHYRKIVLKLPCQQ